jgi:hypothetical protein
MWECRRRYEAGELERLCGWADSGWPMAGWTGDGEPDTQDRKSVKSESR